VVRNHHASLIGPGQPLELPRAGRAAAPFAVLALLSTLLLLVPEVPASAAGVAAVAFALAAAARGVQQHRALARLQASIDQVLLRKEPTPLSPILVWRAGQLTSPAARDHLAASVRRVERSADTSHLAGASPLNRPAVRASGAELDALVDCLLGTEPVRARGVLLVRRLLDDPGSPLYGHAPMQELQAQLRRALGALREGTGARA
jgi:hypothetical protein